MTPTPKEILRKRAEVVTKAITAVQAMPDNQAVTISPELVAILKETLKTSA